MAVINRPKCTYWFKRRECTHKYWALFVGKGANERLYAMSEVGCAFHDRQGLNKTILEALEKGHEISSKHRDQVGIARMEEFRRLERIIEEKIRHRENRIRELQEEIDSVAD